MNVIQCYTSTSDSNEDDKDQFYERLQLIVEKWPGHPDGIPESPVLGG